MNKHPLMMRMRIFLTLVTCLLSGFWAYSQSLNGTIVNNHNDPLIGVNIVNLSNGTHTHSDENGKFSFEGVGKNDSLQFTYFGYKTETIQLSVLDQPITITLYPDIFSLEEIVISPGVDAMRLFSEVDIKTNPVNSSQEILRMVPGLIIGQHAGGGKAEQIFLRGFDIDHGTDINITVDEMPVNMVSHAHGQGYADLHFLIPETIEKIDFGKGPYYAEQGNFNTAGYVNFQTKDRLENNLIKLEAGQFNTKRILGMMNVLNKENSHAYFASEFISTDGPFDSPQNFNRINILGKFNSTLENLDRVSVLASHFNSQWDASGQIPQRSVNDGSIGRFGAIDDTEGGITSRTNFRLNYMKYIDRNTFITNTAFYSQYQFELFSNFTFFLNDPINGDQIRQKESRDILGFNSELNRSFRGNSADIFLKVGLSLRNDKSSENELSWTKNRSTTLEPIQLGDINETNIAAYANLDINIKRWVINPSIRIDNFDFQYTDLLETTYNPESKTKSIISPKLNILYNFNSKLQAYLKTGKGFHSNDTRVVIEQNGRKILPAAYGADLGFIWKPSPRFLMNSALWYLFLDQEFVYVGDAGIVEPGSQTNRAGAEISVRYQSFDWLFWHLDANYTYARSVDEIENYIPLAPVFTLSGGLNANHSSGLSGGLDIRYLMDRPANEANSVEAPGYTVVDLNMNYSLGRLDLGFQIQNLLNTDWNETQFLTESRLRNETDPIEEIHFTPGTPFFIKGIFSFRF